MSTSRDEPTLRSGPHGAHNPDAVTSAIHRDLDAIDPNDSRGFNGARLSATVILVRDDRGKLEVWAQERVVTMRNYPGMTVFPGGGVDPRDFPPRSWDSGNLWTGPSVVSVARRMGVTKYKAHALVFAALREVFEESGTLLVVNDEGDLIRDAHMFHDYREQLETHAAAFSDLLHDNALRVNADLIRPWSRWVGTSSAGNRFDTFFFIAYAPPGQEPDGDSGETDDAGWFPPGLLLDGWRAGLVRLAAPTYAQLKRLARHNSVAEVMADADYSDMRPVIGDPVDDELYREYFTTTPTNRIGPKYDIGEPLRPDTPDTLS